MLEAEGECACQGLYESSLTVMMWGKNNTKAISIPIHSLITRCGCQKCRQNLPTIQPKTCHVLDNTILYFGLNYTIRARGIRELGSSDDLIWER